MEPKDPTHVEIAYAAHTESCTFMLDANGVCRWVVASNAAAKPQTRQWEKSQQAAARCVGAQYVASLDVHTKGGLLEMPRVGVPMLFARVDAETGRVTLVRTAPIVRFETRNEARDDWDSGLRERPVSDQSEVYTQRAVDPVETERDAECIRNDGDADADADDWEIDTRRMRRDEVWHDVEPDPDSNEANYANANDASDEWDIDTATARVELQAAALKHARPPSYGSGPRDVQARRDIRDMQDARDVYQTAPPTRAVPAYSMPVPKAAPLPRPPARPQTLPPAPTNQRPTVPPARGQFHHTRPQPHHHAQPHHQAQPHHHAQPQAHAQTYQQTPLPTPPGYAPPRTPPPTPPPRRYAFEDMQTPHRSYQDPTPHRSYQEMPPPPRPLRPLNPVQPSAAWSDNRATVRRAR